MRITQFVLFLTFLQTGCEKDYEYNFDPSIPLLIPCVICEQQVSQKSEKCEECGFATSDSKAAYVFEQTRLEQTKRENDKRLMEEQRNEQRLMEEERKTKERLLKDERLANEREQQRIRNERIANEREQQRILEREQQRILDERRQRDKEPSVPRDFNARFIPGGKEQITFLEIFENYIQHKFAKSSVDFTTEEIVQHQQEFLEKVKNGVTPLFVKVRNSKIDCSCSNGKVFRKKSGLQTLIVECSLCKGKGYSIGTINYRLFYSNYKLGGVQPVD